MPIGLDLVETKYNLFGKEHRVSKYVINARVGHPARFEPLNESGRDSTSGIREWEFLVDTGADLNILPRFMIRNFIDPDEVEATFDDDLNDFWMDDRRMDWDDVFQKVEQFVADGTKSLMPLVCTLGTLRFQSADGPAYELEDVVFSFNPSADLLERYLESRGELRKGKSVPVPNEVFVVGQQTIQQMRLVLPSFISNDGVSKEKQVAEDDAAAQLIDRSEGVSIRFERL